MKTNSWIIGAPVIIALMGSNMVAGQQPNGGREFTRKLPPGFVSKSLRLDNGTEYKYVVFIPAQYQIHKEHKWPMIVFLHGSGETGEDGVRHTTNGLPVYISMRPTKFPFIVLMPQAHSMWFRGQEAAAVWKMIAATEQEYRVDEDRVAITGLSMGGYGAWELAMIQPDFFSAIVPVCGVAPKEYLPNVVNIPVWAFHGALDKNVPVAGSREAIQELKALGGLPPKYTEYPSLEHQCWDKAYSEEALWKWLLAQKRHTPRIIDYRLPHGISNVWWLAIKAEPNLKQPAHVHAAVDDKNHVTVETEGVESVGLISDKEPIKPGEEIQVTWNGAVVFRGLFQGALTLEPKEKVTSTIQTAGRAPAATAPASSNPAKPQK